MRRGLLGAALSLTRRSRANLATTRARIAHRRLWRPAKYPAWPWASWIWIGLFAIAVVAMVLDAPVGNYRRQWRDELIQFAEATTRAGLSGWYLVPAAALLAAVNLMDWSRLKGRSLLRAYNWTLLGMFVMCSTGLSAIAVTVLKHSIGRARPMLFGEMGEFAVRPFTGQASMASFPSGHSTTIGSVAMAIILLVPSSRIFVIPLALVIASTRIVLSSHYPSDVLAGLLLGSASTLAVAMVFARLGYLFEQPGNGLPRRRKSFSLLI